MYSGQRKRYLKSIIKGGISISQDADWDKHYAIFNHFKNLKEICL